MKPAEAATADVQRDEQEGLQGRSDDNSANGRIAARLIAAGSDPDKTRLILDTFDLAESKTARYAPACAFAELLVRHGLLLEATNLVNETEAEAAFNQETARTYGENPERRNDLEDSLRRARSSS